MEVDAEISQAVRGFGFDTELRQQYGPRYTASIDAAMALVPEGWVSIHSWDYPDRCQRAIFMDDDGDILFRGSGKTSALALCAAALRAQGEG